MLTVDHALIQAHIEDVIKARVERYTDLLRDKMNQKGSGLLHIGNANRSSTPDEFPAVQVGNLRDSIGFVHSGPLAWNVGSFASNNAEGYAEGEMLNNKPVSRGGRRWVTMAYHDPELQAELSK